MKVIDLLNKIANGEEVPSPIYYKKLYFDFDDGDYFNQKTTYWLFNDNDIESILNDEVEIIEEDKEIEKIKYYDDSIAWVIDGAWQLSDIDKIAIDKINEIIDKINEEK